MSQRGAGWTADFAGEGAGVAGWIVTDNTALDATDPFNKFDLSGMWSLSQTAGAFGMVGMQAGLLPAAICPVCGAVSAVLGVASAAMYAVDGNYGEATAQPVGTAIGLVFGGARFAVKISRALKLAKASGRAGKALRWLNRGGARYNSNKAFGAWVAPFRRNTRRWLTPGIRRMLS